MPPSAFLILFLLAHGRSRPPKLAKPVFTVEFPAIGAVDVRTSRRPGETAHAIARFYGPHGLLKVVDFEQYGPGVIEARQYHLDGWPPLVAVVSSWARADGVSLDAALLAADGERLVDLLPESYFDAADALCLARDAGGNPIVFAVRHLPGNECSPCYPKRFTVDTYRLAGSKLTPISRTTTRRKQADWRGAVAELHLSCDAQVLDDDGGD